MKIRALKVEDMEEINRLHDKFFPEFEKTDFTKKMLGAFVITNNDDKIVMAGGVRPIAETIIVTDKSANHHLLGDALLEALRYSMFTCGRFNIELLHAFVKDEAYMKHLIQYGFEKRCQALFKEVIK